MFCAAVIASIVNVCVYDDDATTFVLPTPALTSKIVVHVMNAVATTTAVFLATAAVLAERSCCCC